MEDNKLIMRTPEPNPLLKVPGDLVYSDSEKAEALADNLNSQFQSVPVSSTQMDAVKRVNHF